MQNVQRKLADVLAALKAAALVYDGDGRFLFANDEAERLFGLTLENAEPHWALVDVHGHTLAADHYPLARVLQSGEPTDLAVAGLYRADGTLHWVRIHAEPRRTRNTLARVVVTVIDIDREVTARLNGEQALRHQERLLAELSGSDPLTQLYGRRFLTLLLAHEVRLAERHAQPLAVALLAVNRFHAFVEQADHAAADVLLMAIADTLRTELRDTDLAGRIEEGLFLIVFCRCAPTAAAATMERLVHLVTSQTLPGLRQKVTVSAGVAGFLPGDDTDSLLLRADHQLAAARKAGRNRVMV